MAHSFRDEAGREKGVRPPFVSRPKTASPDSRPASSRKDGRKKTRSAFADRVSRLALAVFVTRPQADPQIGAKGNYSAVRRLSTERAYSPDSFDGFEAQIELRALGLVGDLRPVAPLRLDAVQVRLGHVARDVDAAEARIL